MEKIEIPLVKRTFKFMLCILATLFFTFGVISFGTYLITDGFSWWALIVGLLFLFGVILFASKIYTYLTSSEVHLVVESDGATMNFYNKNNSGKVFNKSEEIDLHKMGSFYVVKKRTRYLMNNYSYAFEEKGSRTSFFKKEINAFPSLFESNEDDRNKILHFVKAVFPEIELGFETAWQKAKRR